MTDVEKHLRMKLIQMVADPSNNLANIVGGAMMLMALCGDDDQRAFAQEINQFVADRTGTLQ